MSDTYSVLNKMSNLTVAKLFNKCTFQQQSTELFNNLSVPISLARGRGVTSYNALTLIHYFLCVDTYYLIKTLTKNLMK